ncbi:MAG TPA: glycosyltransferase family 9 protein [Candidatus Baltobacteraceae bacterium]|nr:glycosyltransferase family 9 protein [Candidatus Baltobacteraceae bacterium]
MRCIVESGETIDVLTMLPAVTEYAKALPIGEVIELPLLNSKRIVQSIRGVATLRRRRYKRVFLPFPATRWQYAAVAGAIGGGRTITHRYGGASSALSILTGARQIALLGGHRTHENMRLLNGTLSSGGRQDYWMPHGWKRERIRGVMGVHVGTMTYKGNESRRWPLENFAAVCKEVAKTRPVRVFFGPNERADYEYFQRHLRLPNIHLVREPLATAAQSVSECEVFVANDSGFAHLASGLGVKTIALFGMTQPLRAAPLGPSLPLRTSDCPPCHDEGLRRFSCARGLNYKCVRSDLTVESVLRAIATMLFDDNCTYDPPSSGKFQLYGRVHG